MRNMQKLDNALQARNAIAVRETFEAFATLNRESLIKAYNAAQNQLATPSVKLPLEAVTS